MRPPRHAATAAVCSPCLSFVTHVSWRCSGHGSFSSNKKLNDVVGNITHSSILVPYHGWRISHRTHHANHGHVENDESWYPTSKSTYDNMVRAVWPSYICPLDRCLEFADSFLHLH